MFIRQKNRYAAPIVMLLIASISAMFVEFVLSYEGNNYQYSFAAMLVFGGVSLVLPSTIVGYMRDQKHSKMIEEIFY